MTRSTTKRPVKEVSVPQEQGPKRRRSATTLPQQLDGDACKEAISFLVHSPDEASVFQRMKMTFQHRQDLVHDPQRTADVFIVLLCLVSSPGFSVKNVVRQVSLLVGTCLDYIVDIPPTRGWSSPVLGCRAPPAPFPPV